MSERKTHWENIYQTRSPLDVSWYQERPSLSLELISNTGIGRDSPIIDVGGGASCLVDYLYKAGYRNLSVLDISANALAYSRERLGEVAKSIKWYESDVTHFVSPHPFALWHDRTLFHFLVDPADRKKYIEVMNQSLQPAGHLIIAGFALGGPTQCSGLDIVQYDAAKLMSELGDDFDLVEERPETHITPAEKEQKLTYFRFARRDAD
jgi:SAM-dependent methyltransferase